MAVEVENLNCGVHEGATGEDLLRSTRRPFVSLSRLAEQIPRLGLHRGNEVTAG
jgi:hypothetical protein